MFKGHGKLLGREVDVEWKAGRVYPREIEELVEREFALARAQGERGVTVFLQYAPLNKKKALAVYAMLERVLDAFRITDGDLGLEPTPPGAVN